MIDRTRPFTSSTRRATVSFALLLALAGSTVAAQKSSSHQAVITSAVADLNGGLLSITGEDLPAKPIVMLALVQLRVESASAAHITATLPFDLYPPGTYLLTVQSSKNHGRVNFATFNVTLGATGPAGPIGPMGPNGPTGPAGPPGPSGAFAGVMCPAKHALQGINANGTPVCLDLDPDVTRPKVAFANPGAMLQCIDAANRIGVQFSEAMAPGTINSLTFTVSFIRETELVAGTIVYDPGDFWVFIPNSALVPYRTYVATITTAATDLAGNGLKEDFEWYFATTGCDPQR